MSKYLHLALLPLVAAGCVNTQTDAPAILSPAQAVSSYVTPTPIPRIVGKEAPLLAHAVVIPETRLPNPNGYDLLVKATESVDRKDAGSPLTIDTLSPEEDLKRQRASTLKNAAALALVRQALKLPIVVPSKRGPRAPSPPYSGFRWLSRIVLQEGAVFAADRHMDRAMNSALDVVEMGAALQNGSNEIGMLVGLAIESMGRSDIMRRRAKLNSEQAAQSARRLESIDAKRPAYAEIQREVTWNNLSEMRDILRDPEWKKFHDGGEAKSMAGMLKGMGDINKLRQTSDLQIESNFMAASDAILARARLPYSPKLPVVPDPTDALSTLLVNPDTSLGITRSRVSYERNAAASRMLIVELAREAFWTASRQNPQSLQELVPKYLSAVPRDPFAPGSELRYERQGESYVLYSVGPDGVDNGGDPIKGRGISLGDVGDMLSGSFK